MAPNSLATLLLYVPLYENRDGSLRLSSSGLSLDNIYRYWDGPLYLVVAKTLCSVGSPAIGVFAGLEPVDYAADFPGYPAAIRMFSYAFGYPNGMIAAIMAVLTRSPGGLPAAAHGVLIAVEYYRRHPVRWCGGWRGGSCSACWVVGGF